MRLVILLILIAAPARASEAIFVAPFGYFHGRPHFVSTTSMLKLHAAPAHSSQTIEVPVQRGQDLELTEWRTITYESGLYRMRTSVEFRADDYGQIRDLAANPILSDDIQSKVIAIVEGQVIETLQIGDEAMCFLWIDERTVLASCPYNLAPFEEIRPVSQETWVKLSVGAHSGWLSEEDASIEVDRYSY